MGRRWRREGRVILSVDGCATRGSSSGYLRATRREGAGAFHGAMNTFDTLPLIVAPLVGIVILLVVTVANVA